MPVAGQAAATRQAMGWVAVGGVPVSGLLAGIGVVVVEVPASGAGVHLPCRWRRDVYHPVRDFIPCHSIVMFHLL